MLRQQHGVAQQQGRRGVENHQVVARQLADHLQYHAAALRAQQLGGIRRHESGGEQIQPLLDVLHQVFQDQLEIGEQAGESLNVVCPQIAVQHGTAHVRIHQQHPLAHLGHGLGKKSCSHAFPLSLGGRSKRH